MKTKNLIKKKCKIHGELNKEDIYCHLPYDLLTCAICKRESVKRSYIKNHDFYVEKNRLKNLTEKYKTKNKEKKKKSRENLSDSYIRHLIRSKSKKIILNITKEMIEEKRVSVIYRRIIKKNPIEHRKEKERQYKQNATKKLSRGYLCKLLSNNTGLNNKDITENLIHLKEAQIKLMRQAKKIKNEK